MVFDAWAFIATASPTALAVLALLGILKIRDVTNRLIAMQETIESLGKAALTKDGEPIFDKAAIDNIRAQVESIRNELQAHNKRAEGHYVDLEHLANTETWKTCDINKCIHLQQIFHKFDKMLERFDSFDKRAEETRGNTSHSLQSLDQGQKELGKELGLLAQKILTVLADSLKSRGK